MATRHHTHRVPVVRLFAPFRKPCSYFVCLAVESDIFEKGVPHIKHTEKDGYYQCLRRLRGPPLQEFLHQQMGNAAWCKKALKDFGKVIQVINVPVEDETDMEDEPGLQEPPLPAIGLPPPPLQDLAPEWTRCCISGAAGKVKVYFDHRTSNRAEQRTYANCLGGNANCFQWRMARDFGTRDQVARCFYCWASSHAVCTDRESHMALRPTAQDLAMIGEVSVGEF